MEVITTDTYEASYYLYHYANVDKIEKRRVQDNKVKKKGYYIEAKIYLSNVREVDRQLWLDERAYVNAVAFCKARLKLKKLIYRY